MTAATAPPTLSRGFPAQLVRVRPSSRRPVPKVTEFADKVVRSHAKHGGTHGLADDTARTISENADSLRFEDFGWEKD